MGSIRAHNGVYTVLNYPHVCMQVVELLYLGLSMYKIVRHLIYMYNKRHSNAYY